MKLNIEPISQRDASWSRQPLGEGTETIGGYGCVLCSVTMQVRYHGKQVNPLQLNEAMKNAGGYVGTTKNIWNWETLTKKVYSDIVWKGRYNFETDPADLDIIDAQLEKKQPVIVKIEADEIGSPKGDHFILIIGKEGDDYWVNDPWWRPSDSHPSQYLMSQFLSHNGSRKPEHIILGMRIYEGPIMSDPHSDDAERALEILQRFKDGGNVKNEHFGNLEGAIRASIGAFNELPGVEQQLNSQEQLFKTKLEAALQESKNACNTEKDKLNSDWQSKYQTAKNTITQLKSELKQAQKISIPDALEKAEPGQLFGAWLKSIFKKREGGEET